MSNHGTYFPAIFTYFRTWFEHLLKTVGKSRRRGGHTSARRAGDIAATCRPFSSRGDLPTFTGVSTWPGCWSPRHLFGRFVLRNRLPHSQIDIIRAPEKLWIKTADVTFTVTAVLSTPVTCIVALYRFQTDKFSLIFL